MNLHDLTCGCPNCDRRAVNQAEDIRDGFDTGSTVLQYVAALWAADVLPKLEKRVRRMNLQEQGLRYIWRPALRECLWCAPALKQAGDVDCTGMSDREFEQFIFVQMSGRLL